MKKDLKSTLTDELLDQLLNECGNPSDLLDGPFMQELNQKLVNRALQAEMNHHLGYKKYEVEGHHSGNSRNGSSKKHLKCGEAEVLGVNTEGQKEVLGLWSSENEGAKFWRQVLTELKNRGLKDILIACIDGLKGFQ